MRFELIRIALLVLIAAQLCPSQEPAVAASASRQAQSPAIQLDRDAGSTGIFRVTQWQGISEWKSEEPNPTAEKWRALFSVYVDQRSPSAGSGTPPVLGSYRIEDKVLVFEPRFPLQPGLRYRAVFNPAIAESGPGSGESRHHPNAESSSEAPITVIFEVPEVRSAPSTTVQHVYPTRDRLPENQLKFYIHFSAAMSRAEAYRRIRLLDESGAKIDLPFLELDQELWDREGKRLTIFFDPGRVKRGLVPHEEAGPPIEAGKKYTLLIDRDWPDAAGRPLRESFRKLFSVGPPDRDPPRLEAWRLSLPKAGTREPLTVEFPEPMDRALLARLVDVTDPTSQSLEGSVEVDREETRWRFTPREAWKPGSYFLAVGATLEDLAGNSIDRPFEMDVFERVEERISHETKRLRFEVKEIDE